MGHAHHFLSRLDRLSLSHVEIALALYRDDARLRYLLEHAHVPEGADRVAVSLDDPHKGPFVLVTRTGHFVTCLGRGMRVGDLPVVTRAELDALTAKHGVWQAREEAKSHLVGSDGQAQFLFGRLLDAGPCLAREELQALAALHPLIGDVYHATATQFTLATRQILFKLKSVLRKRGARITHQLQLEQLEVYWKSFFAAGHLAVLSMIDDGELIRQHAAGDERRYEAFVDSLIAVIVDGSILSRTTRGAWALGALGPTWIPYAKRRLAKATTAYDGLSSTLALLAIAARHEAARAEIVEVFTTLPSIASEEALVWARFVSAAGTVVLENLEEVLANHRRVGAAMALDAKEGFPQGSRYRYARAEDVPPDIAFSMPFQAVDGFAQDPELRAHAISMTVAAARAAPEQLYLPRACVEFIEQKWEPEMSLMLMEGWLAPAQPAPRPTGPSRSAPCPCGSGEKYKRCCWRADAG